MIINSFFFYNDYKFFLKDFLKFKVSSPWWWWGISDVESYHGFGRSFLFRDYRNIKIKGNAKHWTFALVK
jgi:hypothetical protein